MSAACAGTHTRYDSRAQVSPGALWGRRSCPKRAGGLFCRSKWSLPKTRYSIACCPCMTRRAIFKLKADFDMPLLLLNIVADHLRRDIAKSTKHA